MGQTANRNVMIYYAWSRAGEAHAPLAVIDDRFPTLFESRRLGYPRFQEFDDPARYDQGVAGFLDHIQRANFVEFAARAAARGGRPTLEIERGADDGSLTTLADCPLDAVDTLVVISFDSFPTGQEATAQEIAAVQQFLARPGTLACICPHHVVGEVDDAEDAPRRAHQLAEFLHHGDRALPPKQRFGSFARTLLAGLGVPVENRFGLRPAAEPDGSPSPIEAETALDRHGLLHGVETFNLHPHLPQLERLGPARDRMDVLARQKIDLGAPPHPFTSGGRSTFDALLQSRPDVFAGTLLVSDTTMWSSTAGGLAGLRRFWSNVLDRPAGS